MVGFSKCFENREDGLLSVWEREKLKMIFELLV